MKYTYMLNMDNEKFESCTVIVKFVTDAGGPVSYTHLTLPTILLV